MISRSPSILLSINRFALNRNWQNVPPTPKVVVRVRSPCSLA
ncbi:hypothetical protein RBWH47_00919 [Rhodopirellula baltica WH47]|uniref:Uncharacterized protein n=1 Tax=Rhodopirellula baltica WH47 TaxID=991778 RepID=F2AQG6_RHOBT|nr:hypothetical protein RBWH47_00919 [Rhodopirellula baltica WH47]